MKNDCEKFGNCRVPVVMCDDGCKSFTDSGIGDRDADKERLATGYYESQAKSQPEQVNNYDERRGR